MLCPLCGGEVPLPPRGEPAICFGCGKAFAEVADLGWWDYSVEVYVPKEERDA